MGQDQTSLLNHCLSAKRRPQAMTRALLSDTNNTSSVDKQYILKIEDYKQNRMVIDLTLLHYSFNI